MSSTVIAAESLTQSFQRVANSDKCSQSHSVQYQMMTNEEFYATFKLMHPDIAEHCDESLFFIFRSYWVQPPSPRTYMCASTCFMTPSRVR